MGIFFKRSPASNLSQIHLNSYISTKRLGRATDKGLPSARSLPCRVSHSRSPLIKLQPCSLLSCWQTKVLKRTPSVIASNLRHNVVFHVNWLQRKGSCCSLSGVFFLCPLSCSTFTLREVLKLFHFVLWNENFIVMLCNYFFFKEKEKQPQILQANAWCCN